jgi:protein TonB
MENKINYAALSQDEIIFIDRNKAYGAFDLRQSYNQHVKRAILGTIFFTSFAIGFEKLYASRHPVTEMEKIALIANISAPIEIVTPPPPTPKPEIKQVPPRGNPEAATSMAVEMKPAADNTHTDSIAPIDPETAISDHAHDGAKGETPGVENGADLEIHVTQPPKEVQTVSVAEIMPEFPGGEQALLNYIRSKLRYPDYDNEAGIQGKAVVGFVIDENGKVTDVKIMKSVSRGIDRESMRVISSLPDFKPGMQSGRKVRVRYVVPLDFHQQ